VTAPATTPQHALDDQGLHVDRPNTIGTFTGRIDPLDPRPEEINIADIAHALSRMCRYNGHCVGFISVARHSIWVSDELHTFGPDMQFAGLLHDAAEAYIGDVPRPIKRSEAMEVFKVAEAKLEKVIAEVFGTPFPIPAEVMEADHYVLTQRELPDLRYTYFGDYRQDEDDFLARFEQLETLR
jgi:5'-deoxynucleotidase YfbR-like HD superfamily hydrolase